MVQIGNRPLRIAIGTGHANTSPGNSFETALNKKCTHEVVKLCRASNGFEVRCYTPNDGLGTFDGPLDAAAATVRKWLSEGWRPDILHELHHEGHGNPNVRGGFIIYPDSAGLRGRNAGNIDKDVRDHGPTMGRIITGAIGVPLRGNGTMSERNTGVGGQGFRLGLFGAWAERPFIENSCQFITEAATYTNAQDLAIMKRDDFPARQARGILEAYASLARAKMGWTFAFTIGERQASSDDEPASSSSSVGLPIPDVLVKELFPLYDPNGSVSKLWADHGRGSGMWPAFRELKTIGANRVFLFEGGLTIVADAQGAVRLAK
jgi:hypothetical protein